MFTAGFFELDGTKLNLIFKLGSSQRSQAKKKIQERQRLTLGRI